jgi:hypothetical protein
LSLKKIKKEEKFILNQKNFNKKSKEKENKLPSLLAFLKI